MLQLLSKLSIQKIKRRKVCSTFPLFLFLMFFLPSGCSKKSSLLSVWRTCFINSLRVICWCLIPEGYFLLTRIPVDSSFLSAPKHVVHLSLPPSSFPGRDLLAGMFSPCLRLILIFCLCFIVGSLTIIRFCGYSHFIPFITFWGSYIEIYGLWQIFHKCHSRFIFQSQLFISLGF